MSHRKRNSATTFLSQITYERFATSLIDLAKPISSKIVLKGCEESSTTDCYFDISESIRKIADDLLRKGAVKRELILVSEENGRLSFCILDPRRAEFDPKTNAAIRRVVKFSISDLGIKLRKVKRLYRFLRHSVHFDSKTDLDVTKRIEADMASNEILDRVGRFIPWTASLDTSFTSAYNMLNRCDQIILAIRFCNLMAQTVNSFFQACGHSELALVIPAYPLDEYEQSRELFILGEKDEDEFSKLVYRLD